eukprot:1160824-Pelagomonas_calceolata.AAC.2
MEAAGMMSSRGSKGTSEGVGASSEALRDVAALLDCLDQQLAAGTNFEFCQALLQLVLQAPFRGTARRCWSRCSRLDAQATYTLCNKHFARVELEQRHKLVGRPRCSSRSHALSHCRRKHVCVAVAVCSCMDFASP